MRIVHIIPNAPYNDYWGYQDNLLPKYQRQLGHEVTVIATNKEQQNGKVVEIPCAEYFLDDGVYVIRRKIKKYPHRVLTNLKSYIHVYDVLVDIKPDLVFFHGLLSSSIFDAIKYKKKNSKCVIVQDNHLDYNIGYPDGGLKHRLIRTYYRLKNKKSIRYVARVYGVTPWRKTYAEEYFKIPPIKTDVLIMGADDAKIDFKNRCKIKQSIREKYNVQPDEFFIVTGGKIDQNKKIDLLMEAVKYQNKTKLLIFGDVLDDVKQIFDSLIKDSSNIIYAGWVDSGDVYQYFLAADLVVFPGQHSVLWEQACATKVPCLFQKWEGMDHVNNGGNSDFVSPVTVNNLVRKIGELHFTEKYYHMKSIAESKATDVYLYSQIARKSLECVKNVKKGNNKI